MARTCCHGHEMTSENTYTRPSGYTECRQCKRSSGRIWTEQNLEENRRRVKAWAKANPEKMLARSSKWYYENRDRALQAKARWRDEHPEKMREYRRKWKLTKGPTRASVTEEYGGLLAVYERDAGVCHYCGEETVLGLQNHLRQATRDHKIPIALGGPDTLANVVLACRSCNAKKGIRLG